MTPAVDKRRLRRGSQYRKLPSAGSLPYLPSPAGDATRCRCWWIHLSFSRKMFIGGLSWQTSPGMWSIFLFKKEISIFDLSDRFQTKRLLSFAPFHARASRRLNSKRYMRVQLSFKSRRAYVPFCAVMSGFNLLCVVILIRLWSYSGWVEVR